jgi:class 3 adenylate cyclase/tetratricopeptide (TPR) repeat protein
VGRDAAPAPPERDPRDYTPRHLADKILQSKSALEGERKQVTVLFADVKGSMELAEGIDPEEWHRILERFFRILADGVHRFEGTVNQYTGDGIMALFGAPVALEDDAQRACYAALHLRDALRRYADELRLERGLSFSVRMGINTGEVVVGKIGDDLRMDYTAQGQTVGLAARMEQLAEPGKTLLTEHTAKLAAGFFELRDLGASKIRGLAEPLHVYELEGVGGARTRLDVSRAQGFSKFVGREGDLQVLEAALARSREASGQVVGVVAEAGVGKSRLCYEFAERCRARGLTVLEGRAVSHGRNVPFLPILQIFRDYYGIVEQDDARTAREKIAGRLLLIDEGFREALPLAFEFLGVADPGQPAPRMDPEARQRQHFGVLRRLVREGGEAEPGVTLIEDLHWMDGGSLGFLEQWVEAIGGARGLLLVNFRPEYHAEWMGKSYYQQLPLAPLGPEATRELVADLLGGDPSTEGLAEAIHARTAGNPFFTEEVVQSLVESGQLEGVRGSYRMVSEVGTLEVPATVQAVLAARIDRLPEREKQVLQAASVIGREFSEPVLEAVAGLPALDLAESLRALTGAEFLYEQSLYPVAEYAFKHPLTQEVAYGAQLGERRARVHATVARAIEELEADKLEERSALLAHHWEAAGEALEAARWHARAARWVGISDLAETVRHAARVRSLLEEVPESSETRGLGVAACVGLLMGGWRMGMPEKELEAVFGQGREFARREGDLRSEGFLVGLYAGALGLAGEVEQYVERTLECERLAERCGDPGLILATAVNLAYAHFCAGRLDEACRFVGRGLESPPEDPRLGSEIAGFCPYPWLEGVGRQLALYAGSLDAAREAQRRGVEIARRLGDVETLSWTYGWAAALAEFSGETAGCLERCREGFEIAERTGSTYSRASASVWLGQAHVVREEWAEAAELLERAVGLSRRHRTGLEWEPLKLSLLAAAQLGLGRLRAAREAADEAIAVARRRGTRGFEVPAQLARARVLRRSEGAAAAGEIEAAIARARALIDETGFRAYAPFVHEERSRLAMLLGDDSAARRELRETHRLYTEMGATGHVQRLAREFDSK